MITYCEECQANINTSKPCEHFLRGWNLDLILESGITQDTSSMLITIIKQYLENGWICMGGVAIDGGRFSQALLRKEKV